MVEIEQLVAWVKESGEVRSAELLATCTLDWKYIDTYLEVGGNQVWDLHDLRILAPAKVLKQARVPNSNFRSTIETAIRDLIGTGSEFAIREISWAPRLDTPPTPGPNELTEVTRRAILDGIRGFNWFGRLGEIEFLSRLYDLNEIASSDRRFQTAAEDIWQHRVNNQDWTESWILEDSRFDLLHGSDDNFLKFLCETVHPVVRPDTSEANRLAEQFNDSLQADGWQLTRAGEISGRPKFRAAKLTQEVEIFTEPTGWPRVDRQTGELRLRLQDASTEEQCQAVGLLCRELMISVAQAVYDVERHPPTDGVTPSSSDAKRMLDAFLAVEIGGGEYKVARSHVRAAFDLANEVQHKRTASFRDAALCSEASLSVVRILSILTGRRGRVVLD